jgi:hypothetical protein
MLNITINGHEKTAPENWNEAPLEKALAAYALICRDDHLQALEGAEVVEGQFLSVAASVMGMDRKFLNEWETTSISEHGEEHGPAVYLAELAAVVTAATGFCFEKTEKGVSLRYGLTRCPYPRIEIQKRLFWYGPSDGLSNITLYELAQAFTAFENYAKTRDKKHAHRLLAILYRPGKPVNDHNTRSGYEGDRRLPLLRHESTIEARVGVVARWPTQVQQLLVFWFASCRAQIIASYPNVFSTGEESNLAGERVGNNYGWANVLMSLAGNISSFDATAQTNAGTALVYLSWLEDQRLEAEMKRKKK